MGLARSNRKSGGSAKGRSTKPSSINPNSIKRKVIGKKNTSREIPGVRSTNGLIRLNKYIASTGLCSRRKADELIQAGLITVNGKPVMDLGVKITASDTVKFHGEKIKEERKVYILLNKPKNYVTTVEDPHAKNTVIDLLKGACRERIYPVGRLDRNTTGVLLLTNDGEVTKRLTHPRFNKLKVYHVHLNKKLKSNDFERITTGVKLEDGFIKADSLSYADQTDKSQVGIEIHSGRNHIVKRIFEHLGYEVVKLDRVYFAGLTKKSLRRGEWRFLDPKEITMLKMNAFK